ncbi:MAG: DUF5715 family protein [Bacteroidales bacterium]
MFAKQIQKIIIFGSLIATTVFIESCGSKDEEPRGPHTIKEFRGGFSKTFNDLNDLHIKAAKAVGGSPYKSREDVEKRHRLKELKTNEHYQLDELTHSLPLLEPKAIDLLEQIGKNFRDSLKSKSATDHKIIVTSVLRTQEDIKGLQRRNSNSSSNSAHLYGTTFDIAHGRFERIAENGEEITPYLLRAVLAEVMRDLRKLNRCYVKYEVKQNCFHITVRP